LTAAFDSLLFLLQLQAYDTRVVPSVILLDVEGPATRMMRLLVLLRMISVSRAHQISTSIVISRLAVRGRLIIDTATIPIVVFSTIV
jgi:hypothetical protein